MRNNNVQLKKRTKTKASKTSTLRSGTSNVYNKRVTKPQDLNVARITSSKARSVPTNSGSGPSSSRASGATNVPVPVPSPSPTSITQINVGPLLKLTLKSSQYVTPLKPPQQTRYVLRALDAAFLYAPNIPILLYYSFCPLTFGHLLTGLRRTLDVFPIVAGRLKFLDANNLPPIATNSNANENYAMMQMQMTNTSPSLFGRDDNFNDSPSEKFDQLSVQEKEWTWNDNNANALSGAATSSEIGDNSTIASAMSKNREDRLYSVLLNSKGVYFEHFDNQFIPNKLTEENMRKYVVDNADLFYPKKGADISSGQGDFRKVPLLKARLTTIGAHSILAAEFAHAVVDAESVNQFMLAWSYYTSEAADVVPVPLLAPLDNAIDRELNLTSDQYFALSSFAHSDDAKSRRVSFNGIRRSISTMVPSIYSGEIRDFIVSARSLQKIIKSYESYKTMMKRVKPGGSYEDEPEMYMEPDLTQQDLIQAIIVLIFAKLEERKYKIDENTGTVTSSQRESDLDELEDLDAVFTLEGEKLDRKTHFNVNVVMSARGKTNLTPNAYFGNAITVPTINIERGKIRAVEKDSDLLGNESMFNLAKTLRDQLAKKTKKKREVDKLSLLYEDRVIKGKRRSGVSTTSGGFGGLSIAKFRSISNTGPKSNLYSELANKDSLVISYFGQDNNFLEFNFGGLKSCEMFYLGRKYSLKKHIVIFQKSPEEFVVRFNIESKTLKFIAKIVDDYRLPLSCP